MQTMPLITGKHITRSWGFNLAGQVFPLLVAVSSMPFIARKMGSENFGILSIIWAVLGSLTLFDLGMSRSTTKFLAECLGAGDMHRVPKVFWASLWSQVLIGIAGGCLMAASAPYILGHYLKLAPDDLKQATWSLWMVAGCFPAVLGGNSLRGALEAAQRFDLVNWVRVPAMSCMFVVPLMALHLGLSLSTMAFYMALSRLVSAVAYLQMCWKLFPCLRQKQSLDWRLFGSLLSYGGWVSVSNFIAPILVYADRFVIGSILGLSSVSYYTAPNEAISRTSVLPATLLTTLFPSLAGLAAKGEHEMVKQLCCRAIKSLLLLMAPILLTVMTFSRQILQFWIGEDYARNSTHVLQVFCIGVMANAVAFVPFFVLQGLGRPDATAKIHAVELPLYGLCLWVLLPRLGLLGAAVAWTFRLSLDALLLFIVASRLEMLSLRTICDELMVRAVLLLGMLAACLAVCSVFELDPGVRFFTVALMLVGFMIAAWKYVFDAKERSFVLVTSHSLRAAMVRSR